MLSTTADHLDTSNERKGPRSSSQETTWPRTVEGTVEKTLALPDRTGAVQGLRNGRVGPYRILRRIGQGGMATVYLASREDGEYHKQIAVKMISSAPVGQDLVGRFRSERQILADLDHPNIARLLDGGTAPDGRPYLVMEYVDGLPIDEHCRRRRLSVAERLELFRTVCLAVEHAHRHHVVHRDIKPQNILVTADGDVKLLDFGIAKLLAPQAHASDVDATCTALQPMTPGYASPEQIHGKPVTPASDVYALGLLAYKLLTGRLPFSAPQRSLRDWRLKRMERLRHESPLKPSRAVARRRQRSRRAGRRRIHKDLDAIVLKALRLEPEERYCSAGQLADDVERVLSGRPVAARKGTWTYRTTRFLRRHRLTACLSVLLFLSTLSLGVTLRQSLELAHQRDHAVAERDRAAAELRAHLSSAPPLHGTDLAGRGTEGIFLLGKKASSSSSRRDLRLDSKPLRINGLAKSRRGGQAWHGPCS